MKSKLSIIALFTLAVVAGWTSVETYRLWRNTQQVAASQQIELRVSAKVAASRNKQPQVVTVDPSARGGEPAPK
jgi:hypothetical protein